MDQTGFANCCLSSQTITLSTMGPDWEAMASAAMEAEQAKEERARCRRGSHCHWPASVQLQPLPLCSLCLSASLRARITLRAWHVFSAAEHAKEELLQKKGRLKLVKNKKLDDKSEIRWPNVKTFVWLNGGERVTVD